MSGLLVLLLIFVLPLIFMKILKSLFMFVLSAARLYFYLMIALLLFALLIGSFK